MDLTRFIRDVPDFPQLGVLYRDITPLLRDAAAFHYVIDGFAERYRALGLDAIVGIESRGFLFGAPLAYSLRLPFVPLRKPGKLPAARMSVEYALEYGTSQMDIHQDALEPDHSALIIDDVIATGGTAVAAAKLVEFLGARVQGFAFLLELASLGGRDRLKGYDVFTLMHYE